MKRSNPKKLSKTPKNTTEDKIRLNKYISNSGVCSRREADKLIADSQVKVNGKVVTEMGYKLESGDEVTVDGKKIKPEKFVYILLNKPKGYITTTKDPQERNTVMDLIKGATRERVYPVGRLDRNTSGLLLLTNDGELTHELIHPSRNINKIYSATLDKPLTKADFLKIMEGIQLDDGPATVDELAYTNEQDRTEVGIRIHSGRNRIIRRIFESLDYEVVKLDRVMFGILTKKDLPRGKWRFLSDKEVRLLKARVS
jgi:23S rRNA pseudouridine2605 synthase